jgi:choline dehydrogenase-like flavoprotein
MAVLDPQLQVYGIKKLRVVDCSVMPTIVSANTNVPTMMIAEKAADMVKEKYLGGRNNNFKENFVPRQKNVQYYNEIENY